MSLDTINEFNKLTLKLNTQIRETAEELNADYIDVDPYFQGHRFCEQTKDPWFQQLPNLNGWQSLFHPTLEGQNQCKFAPMFWVF